jgi:putative oxidoreductase
MSSISKWSLVVARSLLGLLFLVFGLNFFFGFLPMPPPAEAAAPFLSGLASSGYVFPLIKAIEVAAGIALLANRFVPLALTLLAPIIVNIVALHVLLAPPPAIALVIAGLELYVAWAYRAAFLPMLRATAGVESSKEPNALHTPARAT